MNSDIIINSGNSDNWKERAGRIGHVAKGIVYGIAGILTLLAALNMGGQKAGKVQVLEFLQKQPFGNVLLILVAIGLACYAFWRFVQSVQDPQEKGNDTEGKVKRTGYFISGILYLGLAAYAIIQATSGGGSSSGGQSQQGIVASLLQSNAGVLLVILIAAGLFAKSLYQFYRVYKGDFTRNIRSHRIPHSKAEKIVKHAGYAGFISRGILIGIIGYFFLQAALQHDPGEVQGSSGAFSFIQQSSYGPWLMALVAFGLVCYGVFMFIVAKYKHFYAR
ncbi:hypothetical protein C900_00206 [Fulvivirga imtechensis AK7]|uniref:DUF1206 domain-containing protein n=1 Tax=Fulvivirga imtechensis AK7 TaxID=1237149 RepID=L8JK13_9BACT|nr:DUF1206 domain-containing protein [Fulvivirga imtechensis]ELR68603.1 hypothetical protein C900_00206 [Fulvivirga imtechensis AK7]